MFPFPESRSRFCSPSSHDSLFVYCTHLREQQRRQYLSSNLSKRFVKAREIRIRKGLPLTPNTAPYQFQPMLSDETERVSVTRQHRSLVFDTRPETQFITGSLVATEHLSSAYADQTCMEREQCPCSRPEGESVRRTTPVLVSQ